MQINPCNLSEVQSIIILGKVAGNHYSNLVRILQKQLDYLLLISMR